MLKNKLEKNDTTGRNYSICEFSSFLPPPPPPPPPITHTHTHWLMLQGQGCLMFPFPCHVSGQWDWRKGFKEEKGFQGRFERTDRGRMADRTRELVPDNWSLVREILLTTGLCLEGWYWTLGEGGGGGVCRRVELLGVKECKGEGVLKGRWEPGEKWS